MSDLRSVLKDIQISIIRQIAIKMKEYEDGIDFTIGEPCQDIPEKVKEKMAQMVMSKNIGYTQTGGMPELKEKFVISIINILAQTILKKTAL